jgi:hypothetical protein
MEDDDGYDWLGFTLNFLFAAIPAWIFVGLLVWRYSPYTEGTTVAAIASVTSIVVGIVAGVWKSGFWDSVQKITSLSPYAKRDKK